jgi:hypothetical protein
MFPNPPYTEMMRRNDIRNLVRQMDAVREFSNSMLGDMSVDRGGPEDVAYRVLKECFNDPIERHAELLVQIGDGSPVAERTLRRLSPDYATRSRAFMEMRGLVNRGLRSLTDNIASDPERAARHILDIERMLSEPVLTRPEPVLTRPEPVLTRPEPVLTRPEPGLTTALTRASSAPVSDPPQCSICYEIVNNNGVACGTCNNLVHSACLAGYRDSAGPSVPCPTCRRPFD